MVKMWQNLFARIFISQFKYSICESIASHLFEEIFKDSLFALQLEFMKIDSKI